MRSHRSSRLARSPRSDSSRSDSSRSRAPRLSPEARALRVLAAGSLAGAIGSPFIARADEASASSVTTTNVSPRLSQLEGRQNVGQGPRVSIVAPSYSDLVRGDTAIVIAVEANGAPTKSVQLFVDGTSASGGGAMSFENLPSAQFNWQTSKFKDGQHQLSVRVTDANGFIGQADTQVYINNSGRTSGTAPKLNWMNAHDGDLLHGQADLQLQVAGNYGVKYIVITVNSVATPDRAPALRASLINRAPYIYSLDTMRLPDGVYVLKARGYDVLQNEGETQQVTFGVSNNGLNPTVIERLDEVLGKQKPDNAASSAAFPKTSSTRNAPTRNATRPGTLTTQTRDAARLTPTQNAATNLDATAAKNIATKNVAASTKSVSTKSASTKSAKTSVRAAVAKPSASKIATSQSATIKAATATRIAKAPVAIKQSPAVDAARLILPRPSLTSAPLRDSAEPSLHSASTAPVFADAAATRAKISAPILQARSENATAQSSTRLARTASQAPSRANIATMPSMTMAVAPSATEIVAPVVKNAALSPEVRQSRSLPGALSAKSPLNSVATTNALSINSIQAAPSSGAQRLAMAPDTRRNSLNFGAAASNTANDASSVVTPQNATIRAIDAAQQQSPLRMTSAILDSSDARIASGEMTARPVRGSDATRVLRQLISLPTNLGTPTRPNTNTPRTNPAITMSPATIAALGTRGAAGMLPALHVVSKGETLRSVAARYGLPVSTLANVNELSVKSVLTVGEKLSLPRALNFRFGGQNKSSDIGAIMVGDTSVAPFRFLFEQQGGTIRWDAAHQRITATNGDNQVTLSIGSREATVNDRKVMMDLAAFLLSGRTMVPIRFFEKALQAQVDWEPSTGRIYISMSNG